MEAELSRIRSGVAGDQSDGSVGEYLPDWLASQKGQIEETTWYSYEVAVERIVNDLGECKLDSLTPSLIEEFYSQLAVDGSKRGGPLKPKTIRNTHVVLRKALDDALRLGHVTQNVAAVSKAPRVVRAEQRTWNGTQLKTFFRSVQDDRLLPAYVLAATTGMRRAELLGLRWSDLDLEAGQLFIAHTRTTAKYKPIAKSPKTKKSRRAIYVDDQTIRVLRRHLETQIDERRSLGADWDDRNDYVFRDELGQPLNPDWFSAEYARRVKQSKLPKIRLHDLRHSYATIALKKGVHPKIVSERLAPISGGG